MTTINTLNTNELMHLNASYATKPQLTTENNFIDELKTALDNISQLQIKASNSAKAFEMGEPNVSLNEVMVNMQKSTVSLQFGIQVRNKFVSAYQEIMNMNV
ncbi:flagellar hook-basal body complex protein FliE [Gilliamella sp. B2840]|uniref:flagellar hook-basal body complex protein FliE n=1 Tax=unclassified Gilliamella TaxID=2685620 RepID=UPI00226A5D6A|nr:MULTISPECIES: flagellar hook-basal body complex protein FliE [unclassified Gilliamella]MCX8657210.1 flagellar hook-basal body complex protein FliE [Gilliamella sp. B2894]MCX8665867.1 flagellar hook-basal body complex protein FliE [Gilliamella sp. B2887]MCX8693717.1 flagellar hook-basal body complex protein FliE [Gilliamella sp. B2881]MCX8697145.1 flagellar hook-basal body complex protein FliE [Gilliamella sp. B2828]MCX8699132.1 flagellar hook-basal body complex protein FliE [Gilliamella sp.